MTRVSRLSLPVVLGAIAVLAGEAVTQTIPVRTVPVASGDQFLILPSATLGMGGARLAIQDSLGGAWSNPAQGSLVTGTAFVGSPTYYSISEGRGGGRTFPVAGMFAGATWFGGAALALQQIENTDGGDRFAIEPVWLDVCCWQCCGGQARTLSETYGRNVYASGYLGARVGGDWSVGIGGSTAELSAMDGVDLLYSGSQRIDQSGTTRDVRIGVHRDGAGDRLSLLLTHSRVAMVHEVTWVEWRWDAAAQRGFTTRRVEANEDQTRTWGAHGAWSRELSAPGWRVGASGTLNYKDHPKIPNYRIQNIPRDPGTTWAYEAAVGFARSDALTTFALDVALQPIWSETWQEANVDDVTASGGRLGIGDRSIENDFFFTNVVIRSGLSHEVSGVRGQLGMEIRSYAYRLEQIDHVDRTYREQDESWIEWSPSFGASYSFDALDLRYTGRVTTGTGLPGTGGAFGPGVVDEAALQSDFVIAPQGPLTLIDATVVTHQLSVRIPVR